MHKQEIIIPKGLNIDKFCFFIPMHKKNIPNAHIFENENGIICGIDVPGIKYQNLLIQPIARYLGLCKKCVDIFNYGTSNIDFNDEWRIIPSYSTYQASSNGKIKKKNSILILKQTPHCYYRYYHIQFNNGFISNNRFQRTSPLRVHRLIAEAFIENPDNKLQINHIDSNRQNNNVCNLEWCTPSENNIHAFKVGAKTITTSLSVINLDTGIYFDTIKDAAFAHNICKSTLYNRIKKQITNQFKLL